MYCILYIPLTPAGEAHCSSSMETITGDSSEPITDCFTSHLQTDGWKVRGESFSENL